MGWRKSCEPIEKDLGECESELRTFHLQRGRVLDYLYMTHNRKWSLRCIDASRDTWVLSYRSGRLAKQQWTRTAVMRDPADSNTLIFDPEYKAYIEKSMRERI